MNFQTVIFSVISTVFLLGPCLPTYRTSTHSLEELDLPDEHLKIYLKSHPELRESCQRNDTCNRKFKNYLAHNSCWGYEPNCGRNERIWTSTCPGPCADRWAETKQKQKAVFDQQADFGYISEKLQEMTTYCKPQSEGDSSLTCAKYLRTCHATNIYFDLARLGANQSTDRYGENLFHEGEVGGHCKLDRSALKNEGQHKSPLQSWFAELESYSSLNFQPLSEGNCDVILEQPTFLMKLDAGVNMYHHMCDFLNLYASQHMQSHFDKNITIIMWDTSAYQYIDLFSETWKAFINIPVIHLNRYDGKRIPGCEGSNLFRAFSQHVLHRLRIKQRGPEEKKVRITLIDRNTSYRNIMNQKELVRAMNKIGAYEVKVAEYTYRKISFTEQLKITHNSDILIGMHGAGLTHLLFLPDWAVVFELYHCEDTGCYSDLAKLRGVKYQTWEKMEKMIQQDKGHHPTLGEHPKFTNYGFDVDEFMRLVKIGYSHVIHHPAFRKARRDKALRPKDEL